ncbi:hypothetical protein BHM03_00051590, partial [Ensete ventricosum]
RRYTLSARLAPLHSLRRQAILYMNSILLNSNVSLIASRGRLRERSFGIEVSILRIGRAVLRSVLSVRSLARLVMKGLTAPDSGNRGIDSAMSANDRVMAPEPLGSHPILEPSQMLSSLTNGCFLH